MSALGPKCCAGRGPSRGRLPAGLRAVWAERPPDGQGRRLWVAARIRYHDTPGSKVIR